MKSTLTTLGCTIAIFCSGVYIGNFLQEERLSSAYSARLKAMRDSITVTKATAFKKGYEEGENSIDWKRRALTDHRMSSKLCKAWWFDSNGTERKVK